MKLLRYLFAGITSLVFLVAPISTLISIPVESAYASGASVETDFPANDFGLWGNSSLYGQIYNGSIDQSKWTQLRCTGWDDPTCANYNQLYEDLILRTCKNELDRSCIDSLDVGKSGGQLEKLSYFGESISKVIDAYTFKATKFSPETKLPGGGGMSIWKSSVPNSDGTPRYFAAHVLLRYRSPCPENQPRSTCSIELSYFKSSVYPVDLIAGTNCKEFSMAGGMCVNSRNFVGTERVGLSLRLDKNLTGWIFGRMQNADFAVDPLDDSNNKIRIEGDVTLVPELKVSLSKSEISKDPQVEKYLKDFFTAGLSGSGNPGAGSLNLGDSGYFSLPGSTSYPDFLAAPTTRLYSANFDKFKLFSAFERYAVPFSPAASNNGVYILRETNSIFWNFAANTYTGTNACSADKSKLHGLVVTNAPLYDQGPPAFLDGFLNYRVAGIHANVDGSLFQGRYTYIVRSETARCYYGFSSAPIEAKVEVLSSDSSSQIATVLVNEKNGFIKLQADNFTFSSPTIRIKLAQAAAITPAPTAPVTTPAASPPASVAVNKVSKQATITCVKGKTVKKVVGTSPKCPAGFVKK